MTKKILSIALLILLLQIPNIMVDGVISNREARHNDAVFSIQDNWARRQTVVGPFLTIPCTRYDGDKLVSCSLHVLPENLQVDSDLKTEIRYRGIYEAVVGIGDLQLQGSFAISNVSNFDLEEVFWEKAVLALGVEDVRGISELDINYNGNTCSTVSGLGTIDVFSAGAHCPVILTEGGAGDMDFAVQLVLRSSGGISFIPVGRTTTVSTRSDWSSPKFDGAYLPAERVISDDGFEAEWKVLHLNRSYPQMWLDGEHNLISSQFGVEWLVETNVHKQSSRTMHYSILFILFTFIAFFAAEIANRKRLHPMQYLLTGFAIIIFYLLLLGFAEYIGFGWAYLLSATAVTVLITAYSHAIFRIPRFTGIVSGILVILYGYLYILMKLEDYALLMGAIGLFVVLSLMMYFSRKIDWYAEYDETNN